MSFNQTDPWITPTPDLDLTAIFLSVKESNRESQQLRLKKQRLLENTHMDPRPRQSIWKNSKCQVKVNQILIKKAVERINSNHEETTKSEISILVSKIIKAVFAFFAACVNFLKSGQFLNQMKDHYHSSMNYTEALFESALKNSPIV